MPTMYNWRVKRSGAGMRVIGDAALGNDQTILIRGHKIGNIGVIESRDGASTCVGRDSGEPVCILAIKEAK